MRYWGRSEAPNGSERRLRSYGSSYSANHWRRDYQTWEFECCHQRWQWRQNPHHPEESTLRWGRRQALSQVPATILLTPREFFPPCLDMAGSLAHTVRVPHSAQALTLI